MIPTKLFVVAIVAALAVISVPVDDLAVGSAAAVVCDVEDVECRVQQLRCFVRAIVHGGVCPA